MHLHAHLPFIYFLPQYLLMHAQVSSPVFKILPVTAICSVSCSSSSGRGGSFAPSTFRCWEAHRAGLRSKMNRSWSEQGEQSPFLAPSPFLSTSGQLPLRSSGTARIYLFYAQVPLYGRGLAPQTTTTKTILSFEKFQTSKKKVRTQDLFFFLLWLYSSAIQFSAKCFEKAKSTVVFF